LKRDMPHLKSATRSTCGTAAAWGRSKPGPSKRWPAVSGRAGRAVLAGPLRNAVERHGNLMVGVDYVQQNLGLPLQTAKAGFAISLRCSCC